MYFRYQKMPEKKEAIMMPPSKVLIGLHCLNLPPYGYYCFRIFKGLLLCKKHELRNKKKIFNASLDQEHVHIGSFQMEEE